MQNTAITHAVLPVSADTGAGRVAFASSEKANSWSRRYQGPMGLPFNEAHMTTTPNPSTETLRFLATQQKILPYESKCRYAVDSENDHSLPRLRCCPRNPYRVRRRVSGLNRHRTRR